MVALYHSERISFYTAQLRKAQEKNRIVYPMVSYYMDNFCNSRANTCPRPDFVERLCLLETEPTQALSVSVVIHNNRTNRMTVSRR